LSESALLLVVAVFGLAIGSFLNVVIHRLPRMMENEWKTQCAELAGAEPATAGPRYNLVVPGSHCPHCRTPLRVIDNIPLVSWVALRGKCGHCGTRISARSADAAARWGGAVRPDRLPVRIHAGNAAGAGVHLDVGGAHLHRRRYDAAA